MKNSKIGLLYILPWIIGMVFLTLYPFINALFISFTDYNLVREPNFIGFANYAKLFKDKDFLGTLRQTLKYTVITVPLQLAFALFIAFILNFKLKAINFYRTAYYVPSLLGGNVAVAVLWRFLFQQDGFINHFLGTFEPCKMVVFRIRSYGGYRSFKSLAVRFGHADIPGRP